MITKLDIVGTLIDALRRDELTVEQLLVYCEENAHILKSNVEQALLRYTAETVGEVLEANLAQYVAHKQRILANYETWARIADRAIEQIGRTYGQNIPDIVLVCCIGLYANGGWAQQVEDRSYICVALERLPQGGPLDILLTHEIVHGIAETNWNTVTSSYNPDHPNIGYLIGALYLKYLHRKYTLQQLRTLGKDDHLNQAEFASFLSTWKRDRSTDC